MATSTIQPKATYTTVSGTVTTGAWAEGSRTVTWTAPTTGFYLIWMRYELNDSSAANRNLYRQLQMRGTATKLVDSVLYYDASAASGMTYPFTTRTISQPVYATAGQTIYPYIHTGTAGIVYNVIITAVKIA